MGLLKNVQTGQQIKLRSLHTLGRHAGSVNSILEEPQASRLHASLQWQGTYWLLQDTSSNGTYINHQAIRFGAKKKIKPGDVIQFGATDATEWVLVNADEPQSMLVPLTADKSEIELVGIVPLPDADSPELTLYQATDGAWFCEDSSGLIQLKTGQTISVGDASWYFVDAEPIDNTKPVTQTVNQQLDELNVTFKVSQNEEHVSMTVKLANMQLDLGERAHHYLMMFLARQRLLDLQQGIEDSEQGWIDKDILCQQTGLDEKHINLHIYRFRKQLVQTQPSIQQLIQIIERRRGELRFAFTAVEIHGGNEAMKLQ